MSITKERREESIAMVAQAEEKLGPTVREALDGKPTDMQIDVLVKLSCAFACMANAQKRINEDRLGAPLFYEEARRGLASVLADLLPLPRGEDFKLVTSAEAEAQMAADPKLAEALPDIMAQIRGALDGIATGKFADIPEAMRSIGAQMIDDDDDEGPKGTLQ